MSGSFQGGDASLAPVGGERKGDSVNSGSRWQLAAEAQHLDRIRAERSADDRTDLPTATDPAYRRHVASPAWLHPWLRLQLAIRAMSTRWGDEWPTVKSELGKALKLREALRKAPWWN